MSSVLIQCRCDWCDRCYFRKVGPGRVPRFCRGACRTAMCRAVALDALALEPGVTSNVKEGRRAAYERRVKADEKAARVRR